MQIEASTEALRKRDGARSRARDVRETHGHARDLFREDAAQGGQDTGLLAARPNLHDEFMNIALKSIPLGCANQSACISMSPIGPLFACQ